MDRSVNYPIGRAAAVSVEFVRRVYAWIFIGLALTLASIFLIYTGSSIAAT